MTSSLSPRHVTLPGLSGKRAIASFLGSAFLLAAAGCLQPDPVGAPPSDDAPTNLEDNGLRAGATSTTNWPPKAGRRYISILSRADSTLAIAFRQNGETATDPLFVPVRLSGTASLYKAGIIPALEVPRIAKISFVESDSFHILPEVADSLLEPGSDTLLFNLRIETDSLEAWSFGYGYLPGTGDFFQTGFSEEKEKDVFLGKPDAFFLGRLDTAGVFAETIRSGDSRICFYIPGTHFFKPVANDSVELGPLAAGDFPLRLLRVTYPDGVERESDLEIYEVEMTRTQTNGNAFRFAPGAKLHSGRVPRRVDLRTDP